MLWMSYCNMKEDVEMSEDVSFEGFVDFLLKIDPVATLKSLGYSDDEIATIIEEANQ